MKTSCNNKDLTWICCLITKEQADADKEHMPAFIRGQLESMAEERQIPLRALLQEILIPGKRISDKTYKMLLPETEYAVYAVAMDFDGNLMSDIHWSPVLTTEERHLSDLTFDITVTPGIIDIAMDITPSDETAYYLPSAIDNSFYNNGYTDDDIMAMMLSFYGEEYLPLYLQYGTLEGFEINELLPDTDCYAIAFGVDIESLTVNSKMTKVPFRTRANQPTDAYAAATAPYWSISGIIEHDPVYSIYMNPDDADIAMALNIEFNESTASAIYSLFVGDITASYDEDAAYQATLYEGTEVLSPGTVNIMLMPDGAVSTLCIIGKDADGNFGDMFMEVITVSLSDASTDYDLFDECFNSMTGSGYAPNQRILSHDALSL